MSPTGQEADATIIMNSPLFKDDVVQRLMLFILGFGARMTPMAVFGLFHQVLPCDAHHTQKSKPRLPHTRFENT